MSIIIAPEGKPSKGKSATINMLFNLMTNNGFEILQNKKRANTRIFFPFLKKVERKSELQVMEITLSC